MFEMSLTRLAAAAGGVALTLTVGYGVAYAAPDLGPIINTTCSYPQVISALNAADPAAAAQFTASPMSVSGVQQFLAATPNERQQMAQMIAGTPGNEQYFGLIQQVAHTCNNY